MFDINSLAIQESAVVHLKHPVTGEPLYADKAEKQAITVTIASSSSKAYRQAVNAMHNRTIKRQGKRLTAEQQKEEGIELLTSCFISADNLAFNGSAVKGEAEFRALLADDKMSWLKNQVDEALASVENFIA